MSANAKHHTFNLIWFVYSSNGMSASVWVCFFPLLLCGISNNFRWHFSQLWHIRLTFQWVWKSNNSDNSCCDDWAENSWNGFFTRLKIYIFREIDENMKIFVISFGVSGRFRPLNEKENKMNGILFGASVCRSLSNRHIVGKINWVAKIIESNVHISYALTMKCEQLNKSPPITMEFLISLWIIENAMS